MRGRREMSNIAIYIIICIIYSILLYLPEINQNSPLLLMVTKSSLLLTAVKLLLGESQVSFLDSKGYVEVELPGYTYLDCSTHFLQ